MKQTQKGFTLVELLAVIIILGVLLLIAIPSVSKYITQSKINTYESNLLKLVDAVRTEVNTYSGEYSFNNNQYLIVPLTCIDLEKGNNQKSPFGSYIQQNSFIAVTRKYKTGTNETIGFNYYVSALDDNNYGVSLKEINASDFKVIPNPKLVKISEINTNPRSWKVTGKTSTEFSLETINKTGKMVTCDAFSYESESLYSKILKDNVAYADTDINFGQPSSDTNGKGLYYTSTNTEDNKTTYYFRGDVNNNYVQLGTYEVTTGVCMYNGEEVGLLTMPGPPVDYYKMTESDCLNSSREICDISGFENEWFFADGQTHRYVSASSGLCGMNSENGDPYDYPGTVVEGAKATYEGVTETKPVYWRIVRINEDGSVRLIKKDSDLTGYFNSESLAYNAGVGYMYGQTDATGTNAYKLTHTNTTDSNAKARLDSWYENNLSNYTHLMSMEAGFCNDRSIAPTANTWASNDTALGYGSNITYYGAYNRLVNLHKPQFACPQTNDLFTTKSSSKGNNALTYPIGLLTADELEYAGGTNIYFDNESYIVTMSPHHWERQPMPHMWVFDGNSMMGILDTFVGKLYPVINLKGTVVVSNELPEGCTKLNGTEACPYIIKTN